MVNENGNFKETQSDPPEVLTSQNIDDGTLSQHSQDKVNDIMKDEQDTFVYRDMEKVEIQDVGRGSALFDLGEGDNAEGQNFEVNFSMNNLIAVANKPKKSNSNNGKHLKHKF